VSNPEQQEQPAGLPWGKLAIIPVVLIALGLVYYLFLADALAGGLEALEDFGVWGLAAIPLMYVVACVFLLPASMLAAGAGFLASLLWPDQPLLAVAAGTAVMSLSMVCGSTAAFLIGRTFGRAYIARKFQGKSRYEAVEKAVEENAFKIIFFVRMSPAFPFNVMNYVFSLTSVRWREFVLASWLGMLPGTTLVVYAGTSISSLTALAEGDLPATPGRTALLLLGLLATVVVVVIVTRIARRTLKEAME